MLHRSSSSSSYGMRQWYLLLVLMMMILLVVFYQVRLHHPPSTSKSSATVPAVVHATTRSELVFLGTGTSAGTPRPKCIIDPEGDCSVCRDAVARGPSRSRNWRGNPSLLIRYRPKHSTSVRNVQIDVGKTFYTAMLYIAPKIGFWPMRLDAVVLTHAHADAVFGLDELRDFPPPSHGDGKKGIPVWATATTRDSLKSTAPYLFPGGARRDGGVARRVSQLDWRVMQPLQPFEVVSGLWMTPIAMFHGGAYQAMGFVIGGTPPAASSSSTSSDDATSAKRKKKKNININDDDDESSAAVAPSPPTPPRIVYISDVSEIPERSLNFLQDAPIDILILEAFSWTRRISSHINLEQAIPLIRQLAPSRTYITGISHDMDHERLRAHLITYRDTENLWIDAAYDGLRLPCDL